MSDSHTDDIRAMIQAAKSNAAHTDALRSVITRQMPALHAGIQLPQNDPEGALLDFVIRYIEHVPNFIDALRGLTREAGIHDYASIFLDIAEEFFIAPPEVVGEHVGLESLLDEAYLAHRLIEEVNDRVVGRCGIPLAPMDMTWANLIVHELIGEPFANDLDFVVHYSTEINMDKETSMDNPAFHRYVEEHKQRGWEAELERWPCLAETLSINLELGARVNPEEAVIQQSGLH